ncbi:zinc finger protein 862-like [Ptychodera flava]|uniref:zinc finger protein 862-like n=1 Tax=Ptychodera flava TaxID=63121 RepID=UPI003969CF1B
MYSAGTDGASVMTGKHKGVATRLQKEVNPFLIAIHCCAHRLALASAQAAHSVKLIDKFEQHLVQIFNYFHYSTKHKARLRNIFGILGQQARLFVRPCDTRWLSVTGSVEAVIANLRAMMICLASDADSGESAAIGLLKIVSTYEFMGTLHLMGDVLSHIAKLSLQQRSTTDFSLVCGGSVNAVCRVLTDMKENPGVRLKTFIDSIPYKEGQSKFYIKTIGNNISDNLQNEFVVELPEGEDGIIIFDSQEKRKIFESSRRKFIDNLVANLESRFEQVDLIKAFGIFVPCQMPPASSPVFKEYGEEEITILCNFYGKDKSVNGKTYPAIINPRELHEEWGLLKHVLSDNHRSMTFQDVWCMLMRQSCHEIYPNIVRLVKIALILPTNTADCERGFSRYNRIKTNSRARLKVSSVSYLMTLALETPPLRNIEDFNFGRSFQVWCSMKQRRIVSSNRNLPSAAADGCSSCVNLSNTLEKLLSSLDRLLKCDFYLNEVD